MAHQGVDHDVPDQVELLFGDPFLDPRLQAYLNIDGDQDDNNFARFHDFWVNFVFDPAFNLHAGKGMVPGSRNWLDGSTRTRFADRDADHSVARR